MANLHPSPTSRYPRWRLADATLPERSESWLKPRGRWIVDKRGYADEATREEVSAYIFGKPWHWPGETLLFLSDVHADADAFRRSLVASGHVEPTGPRDHQIKLLPSGRNATFLIAGDCFDKGPDNLRLLRAVASLRATGARTLLLAGNHDLRALIGMVCAGERDPRLSHLFIRMGVKTVPLLKELVASSSRAALARHVNKKESELRARLFPSPRWYDEFPRVAKGFIPPKKLELELVRIRQKATELEAAVAAAGLRLGHVLAAIEKFRELFLSPRGELHWYFAETELAHRKGSLLFIHAGVDDHLAELLAEQGVDGINRAYHELVQKRRWFELYYGPVGNAFRTKYRETDWPFTERGMFDLHRAGIYAVMHGHRNIHHGQRMIFRNGVLNFECDASMDENTRAREGLTGQGGAVTLVHPDGRIEGVSTDYPNVKVFDPGHHCQLLALTSAPEPTTQPETIAMKKDTKKKKKEAPKKLEAAPAKSVVAPSEPSKLGFEGLLSRDEAASYFDALISGLRKGQIRFRRGNEALTLAPQSHVQVEVKAARKGGKEKLAFEMSWTASASDGFEIG